MNKKQTAEKFLLSALAAGAALTFINLLPASSPAGTTMGNLWLALDRLVEQGLIEELEPTQDWPVARYMITEAGELRHVQLELDCASWL